MAIEAVTPASSNYAHTAGESSSSGPKAATGDSTDQQAARRDRKARLKRTEIQAPQSDTAPPEPGKGTAIDAMA